MVATKSSLEESIQAEYRKLRFLQQPLVFNLDTIPGFSLQTSQFDSIHNVVATLENYLGRKLKILEIGSSQGFFGLQLAEKGHKVISIEWEDENIAFLKSLRQLYSDSVSYEVLKIDLNQIPELDEIEFDLSISMGSLVQVYRTLNLSAQHKFFDFVKKNSKLSIWDIPVFEESASWNWAIKRNPLEDFYAFPFFFELGTFRKHSRGLEWPLILASENYAYIGNEFFRFESTQVHTVNLHSAKKLFRRTINLGKQILKIESHEGINRDKPTIFGELAFLQDKRVKEENKLLFPKILSTHSGRYVSQFSRESVAGMRLDLVLNSQNQTEILKSFVSLVVQLSSFGVFPNDLRPWNIMWDGKICRIIDFSSSDFVDRDESRIPQFLSFLATSDFIKFSSTEKNSWNFDSYIANFNKMSSSLGFMRHFLFDFTWKEVFSDKTFVEKISELTTAEAIHEVIKILENRFPNSDVIYAK
jgi:hypothetical protein